ncbi:MAG: hypothetical protein HQ558_02745 [Candidatus Omnitrophica bacterium]|nr:hypothetical protein [Candidatus Omnitrophota bacterium]
MVGIKRFLTVLIAGVFLMNATSAFCDNGKVIAYYFHGSFRCPTCRNLEQYAKEAIENNFRKELDEGSLVFKPVNVEEEANKHFVNEYQLYTKSLVLSLVRDGKEVKYKNLDKIWEYVRDKTKYMDYVKSEVNNFMQDLR